MAYRLRDLVKGSPRLRGEIDPATAVPAPGLTPERAAELARLVDESESMLLPVVGDSA